MAKIQRGITLYSFQEALYFKKLDLEDTIAACADMGARGVEIIPDQSIREFPNVSDAFIDRWHGMMERYGTVPVCMDDFVETRLYKHRPISEDEQLERFIRAAKLANRLGCHIMREQFALGEDLMTPHLLERCLPYAEKYDVVIGMEIHAPNYLGNPQIDPFMEIMRKNPYAAVILDFSIFMHRIPSVIMEYYLRQGARQEVLDFAAKEYQERGADPAVIAEAEKFGLTPIEKAFFASQFRFNCYIKPETILEYAPFIKHYHAKTFGTSEDLIDDCIDVPRVIQAIKKSGYEGYLCTELEGNRYVHDSSEYDCVEQVWRNQKLLASLL